jgi:hypothetical protein
MIWLIGTLGAAVAAEPPARPPASERRPDDCTETTPVVPNETILCTALAVPPADLADLLADREWAFLLQDRYRLDTAQLEAEKNTLQWQLDYLQTALDHERKPVPLNERPGFWLGVGTAAGLGLTLGSAWAVGQIVPPTP